ncbi:hypothetical protein Q5752_004176 [Cryptotrichosporon argae]
MSASAGPSRPLRPPKPFVCAAHRPAAPDGRFRVVVVSTGSVASVRVPEIVAGLVKDPAIDVQVVATKASLHFYTQERVDRLVCAACGAEANADGVGVQVWTDEDEWSDWKDLGDPILHIELRRWADLVLVAPCSADMLARLAAGLCDTLALSLLRALPQSTPVILCPAMNTHMYAHPFTRKHLAVVQTELGYMISGPQGAGRLACGDDGPGKMTDWREIVDVVQNFAVLYRARLAAGALRDPATEVVRDAPVTNSAAGPGGTAVAGLGGASSVGAGDPGGAGGAGGVSGVGGSAAPADERDEADTRHEADVVLTPGTTTVSLPPEAQARPADMWHASWKQIAGEYGEKGEYWERRWWMG